MSKSRMWGLTVLPQRAVQRVAKTRTNNCPGRLVVVSSVSRHMRHGPFACFEVCNIGAGSTVDARVV